MGKCSIRQALKFIDNHQKDPEKETAEKIASEFTLDPERVKNVIKYFRMYEVQVPKTKKESRFDLPAIARGLLPSGKKDSPDRGEC